MTDTRQVLRLEPDAASAGAARRMVRQALRQCGRDEWAEAAELAVSEIVTNAVLHAHTSLTVSVVCEPHEVLVEVIDLNPTLPTQRVYGERATTGRGMALIAAVTTSHGVREIEGGGKSVWFTISDAHNADESEEWFDSWDDFDAAPPLEATTTLKLLGLPPTLFLANSQHNEGLLRELALYRIGAGAAVDDLAAADRARAPVRRALDKALTEARATGKARNPLPPNHPARLEHVPDSVDLTFEAIGDDPAADYAMLQDVLDEAERLAADGLLLARPGLPEIVEVRDWAAESLIAQLAGQPPSPWPGSSEERLYHQLQEGERQSDWDASIVRESDRGAVAADDANRILAISRPLAELLGWKPEELVGRRVVAIVPPQFREAHVAGFTRHLTTGQAHALNVRLELPVLKADATEILCEFFIEAHQSKSGRNVYIAWITPLDEQAAANAEPGGSYGGGHS